MPSAKYTPTEIEPKWQKQWAAQRTFRMPNPGEPGFEPGKPKYYILDMFPYPSGEGLHVGHPEGYTATDILARWKRMNGFNVLHPMGWDAYGLPAEQYAMKTGTHPAVTTAQNCAAFRKTLQALGFSYDWEREIDTTDPKYYRWTQWIFQQLYKKGLAYVAEVPVWWCEGLGTVLANEEVLDGRSEVGDHPCVRKPLRQWMLKITAYAERLLADLDGLDWPEAIKAQQRHWIGKSEGAEVLFSIFQPDEQGGSGAQIHRIAAFTTRPDTLFGATYMVLAPEHPLVKKLTAPAQRAAVEAYVAEAATKSDLARTDLSKEKSGVFIGAYAHNPVYPLGNPRAKIPIWTADYVLMGYGTGAIMAVPAHDTRDAEFALKFKLPIVPVVMPPDEWLTANRPNPAPLTAPTPPPTPPLTILRDQFKNDPTAFKSFFVGDGVALNSAHIDGQTTPVAKRTITQWLEQKKVGKGTVQYRLRDWLFSRQRYWGEPFPVLHLEDGTHTLVPEGDLPVALPELEDYRPTGTLEPPLAKARAWVETKDPATGRPARRETNTMPQWAGSCWYYLRFTDPRCDERAWRPEIEKYWMPVDLYVGGAEHAVLHLLYSRFWHKVLYDCGLVSTPEPFQRLFNQGLIQAFVYQDPSGRLVPNDEVDEKADGGFTHKTTGAPLKQMVGKMSKSLKNVVPADAVIAEFGADTLRLYEMFLGPLDASKPWNTRDVPGVFRFLQRSWRMIVEDNEGKAEAGQVHTHLRAERPADAELERALHKAIKKVTLDLERMAFNTAISALMVFSNEAMKDAAKLNRAQAERYILLLAPFAPHLAEELWERLGHTRSLAYEPWPRHDEALTVDAYVELAVQINGKTKSKCVVATDASEEVVKKAALEAIAKDLAGKTVAKVIAVKGRLVNVVVK